MTRSERVAKLELRLTAIGGDGWIAAKDVRWLLSELQAAERLIAAIRVRCGKELAEWPVLEMLLAEFDKRGGR